MSKSHPAPGRPASETADAGYPGANLGLPRTGKGSVAGWTARITALVLDWAISMVIVALLFGLGALTAHGWQEWLVLAVFFVQSAGLAAFTGGSLGQHITRIAVVRLDRQPLGLLRALPRQLMVCLVLPALVVDENRRGLHDLVCGTVVLSRR